jgi:RecJ-like exonuclease
MNEPKFISYELWCDTYKDILKEYTCEECKGSGTIKEKCDECDGTGRIYFSAVEVPLECDECNRGYIYSDCINCRGLGVVSFKKQYEDAKNRDLLKWKNYERLVLQKT